MNKKQVLLTTSYSQGGIASVVDNITVNDKENLISLYVTYTQASTIINWIKFPFIWVKFCIRLLFDKNIEIIHLLSADKGSFLRKSILLLTSKFFGKKVAFNIHSGPKTLFYNDELPIIKAFLALVLNTADIIIVLSRQWKTYIEDKCSNKNIKILYNPIPLKEKNAKNKEDNIVNILFMGRLGQRKGAYDLVEAAKQLRNTNIKIFMYGDGDVQEIKELVKNQELEDIVTVMGWISGSDIEKAYRNADVFILPSYDEGLPMSILEAMSYGLPIISTNVGGIPDQIIDNENGYLLEPGNIAGIAEKIRLLAEDKDTRMQMGDEGHNIVRNKFETSKIMKELKHIYSDLLGE